MSLHRKFSPSYTTLRRMKDHAPFKIPRFPPSPSCRIPPSCRQINLTGIAIGPSSTLMGVTMDHYSYDANSSLVVLFYSAACFAREFLIVNALYKISGKSWCYIILIIESWIIWRQFRDAQKFKAIFDIEHFSISILNIHYCIHIIFTYFRTIKFLNSKYKDFIVRLFFRNLIFFNIF